MMKHFARLPCKIKIPKVSSIVHVAKVVDVSCPANSRNYCSVGDEYRASKKYRKNTLHRVKQHIINFYSKLCYKKYIFLPK